LATSTPRGIGCSNSEECRFILALLFVGPSIAYRAHPSWAGHSPPRYGPGLGDSL